MFLFLNILFILVSVLFFTGRLYEVVFLMEEGTNFLVQPGIVTRPLMIGIVLLISVCCGVLIFADKKPNTKKLKIPVGIFGFATAVLFVITSVLNVIRIFTVTGGFLGYDIMMVLASIGLLLYGIKGIKGKKSEMAPMVMTILFPLAMCINATLINVQPIADTFYFYRSLSAVTNLVFWLMLYKAAYSPSKLARPMLYVSGLMNFLISTAAHLAGLIGGVVLSALSVADITMSLALVLMGAFSLFTAFYIMPVKEEKDVLNTGKKSRAQPVEPDEYDDEEYYSTARFTAPVAEPAHSNPVFTQDTQTRQINRISEETIAMLFAQKEERQQAEPVQTQSVRETATQPVSIPVSQPTEEPEETKVIPVVKQPQPKAEKSVFKSSGVKKSANTKTVYKAPKK